MILLSRIHWCQLGAFILDAFQADNQMSLLSENHHCDSNEWQCANKRCIPESWQCDTFNDCEDNSDEDSSHCASRTCRPGQFRCANGRCIPQAWKCDVDNDCGDHSDEPIEECSKFLREGQGMTRAGRHEETSMRTERGHGAFFFSPMRCSALALPANSGTERQSIAVWLAGGTRRCFSSG